MKTYIALVFLAAAALPALTAPTLKDGAAPWEDTSKDQTAPAAAVEISAAAADAEPVEKGREKKSYYGGSGLAGPVPCAVAGQYGAGYSSGISLGHGGAGISLGHGGSGLSVGHGQLVAPAIHAAPIAVGGYGLRPSIAYGGGYGGGVGFGSVGYGGVGGHHYRASEDLIQQSAENSQMAQLQEPELKNGEEISNEAAMARSAYGGGGGGDIGGYGAGGLYGAGLGLARPLGGPAVGVFPGGLGGCGAIPLLVSCSPNLVAGQLLQQQGAAAGFGGYSSLGYGGSAALFGGHGGGGGGGGGVLIGGHGLYRAEAQPEAGQEQTAHAGVAASQKTQQAAGHAVSHSKSSASAHSFQKQSSLLQHGGATKNSIDA